MRICLQKYIKTKSKIILFAMQENAGLEYYEKSMPDLRDVTLCYLVDEENGRILLAMKKRRFGAGKLNGVGGKCEPGESVEAALIRETREEIGVELLDYAKVATISFYFEGDKNSNMNQRVHVFLAYKWNGSPTESEEMRPEWHELGKLDFEKMWDDDKYWLPLVLDGMRVNASFLFGEGDRVKELRIAASRP